VGKGKETEKFLPSLVESSKLRGRDGTDFQRYPWGFIGASRARPLPEGRDFTYPHRDGKYSVVFNGTISNADEIAQELKLNITVDTEVIVPCIKKFGYVGTAEKLVGGFAILAAERTVLHVIRNFKTLWYLYVGDVFLIASEREFLLPFSDGVFSRDEPRPFPRNKVLHLVGKEQLWSDFTPTIWGGRELDDNKALIVASAGLDSATAAAIAKKVHHKEVLMLNFDYGQRASVREWKAVRDVAASLGCGSEQIVLPLSFRSSPLTNTGLELPLGKISVESTLCWTPARNFMMLAVAAAVAEERGIKWLYFGNNMEEEACLLNVPENVVRSSDGCRILPSDVCIGDELLAWDEKEKKIATTHVTKLYEYDHQEYLRITLKGRIWKDRPKQESAQVMVSKRHPFFVKGKGWIEAGGLEEGDVLFRLQEARQTSRFSGENNYWGRIVDFFDLKIIRNGLVVSRIEKVRENCKVYNYHCKPYNNFFIGKQGILTHNSGYSDNDLEFVVRMNAVLEYGTLRGVQVKRALARLMKVEIITLGTYLGVDYSKTWSCLTDSRYNRVYTWSGSKRPSDVKVGDELVAFDGSTFKKTVVQRIMIQKLKEYYRLDFRTEVGVKRISVTGEHPLLVVGKGWVKAEDLQEGDQVVHLSRGQFHRMTKKAWVKPIDKSYMQTASYGDRCREGQKHLSSVKSESMKKNNPMKKPEVVSKNLASQGRLPSSLERRVMRLSKEFSWPLLYTGKGGYFVQKGKESHCPDFRVAGTKKVIEVYDSTYRHRSNGYARKLEHFYRDAGYRVLMLDLQAGGLTNQEVVSKIQNFISNGVTLIRKKKIVWKNNPLPDVVYNYSCTPYHNFVVSGLVTHNCDEGFELPCGKCGCCTTRRHAFIEAGLEDKQEYMYPLVDTYVSGVVSKPDINQLLELVKE
jgi:7-cyano-7-deazaguanine synthase in queuosine biosynthesis